MEFERVCRRMSLLPCFISCIRSQKKENERKRMTEDGVNGFDVVGGNKTTNHSRVLKISKFHNDGYRLQYRTGNDERHRFF